MYFGTLWRVVKPFLLRSNDGLVFAIRHYTRLVRSHRLKQEFITRHYPRENCMVERVIRALREQCVHLHPFETQHSMRIIADLIQFSNHRHPHQAIVMKTLSEAYAVAA